MTVNRKATGLAVSIPKGMMISGLLSLVLTLCMSGIIAYVIENEMMDEMNIGYAIMLMLIVTSYLSATIAWRKIKHRRMLVCTLAGMIYFGILLSITALFFGGQYDAVLETVLLIMCGSALAMLPIKKTGRKYWKKRKAYC